MSDDIFYTICDENGEPVCKLNISYDLLGENQKIGLETTNELVTVSNQQLAEIAVLLLAIAGPDVDFSSCDSVLDGFSLKCRPQIESLLKEIEA